MQRYMRQLCGQNTHKNEVKHDSDVVSSVNLISIWAETRSYFITAERTFKLANNFPTII